MQLNHLAKFIFIIVIGILVMPVFAFSQTATVDQLNKQIQTQKSVIEQINKEIAQKQEELKKVGAEKSTLQAAIKQLEGSRSKVESELKLTQSKIKTTELTLEKLSHEIKSKEENIVQSNQALAQSLRVINETESESLLELVLNYSNLSLVWDSIETLLRYSSSMKVYAEELRGHKKELEVDKNETEENKKELVNFQKQLAGQKQTLEVTKKEKDTILTQTKNQEAAYQKLLAEKIAQKEAFEKELFNFENQLKIAIDPAKIPTIQSGVLGWPLDSIRITQYFGKTVDAQRLYVSGTHNGMDFAAPIGTGVKSALDGVIEGIGNTDGGGCYSYGRWILVKHPNGLSTMYAHLSSFAVATGDVVKKGQIIGYSGNTGYSTGPHLHFTLYASQGVRVQQYTSSINCKTKIIPIADSKAYLDPLTYLPK